jgi:hypothetical protein
LPEPLSPVKRTPASVGPTRSIKRNTSCIAAEFPSKESMAVGRGAGRSGRLLTLFITNLLLIAFV